MRRCVPTRRDNCTLPFVVRLLASYIPPGGHAHSELPTGTFGLQVAFGVVVVCGVTVFALPADEEDEAAESGLAEPSPAHAPNINVAVRAATVAAVRLDEG